MKSLLFEYFNQIGKNLTDRTGILTADEEPDPGEFEDAYNRFYKPALPLPETGESHFIQKVNWLKRGYTMLLQELYR